MNRVALLIEKTIYYYKLFGLEGIKYSIRRKFAGNSMISVKIASVQYPIFLRNNTSDITVFYKIFQDQEYKIDRAINPKVIFDCGANIGLASVYFKNKFPDAVIVAIEPDSSNFQLLVKNTEKYSGIHCLNCGVWNKPCNLEVVDGGQGKDNFIVREASGENERAIKAVSIRGLMDQFGFNKIDILKIDIEGSEKEVFEGGYETWLPYVGVVMIELHDRLKKECSKMFFKAVANFDFQSHCSGENIICFMESNLSDEKQS